MTLGPESVGGGAWSLRRGSKSNLQFQRDVKGSVIKDRSVDELIFKVKGRPVILNDTIFMKSSLSDA